MPTAANTAGSTIPAPPSSTHPVPEQVRQPAPVQMVQLISYSADGSVNGKNEGRSREWISGTEVGRRERLDGARQVGEADAAVDDQPLDLVEDGKVTGVGCLPAVAAPGGDDEDRGWLGLHHPDLDRRGVRAQQRRSRRLEPEIEGVPHAAGGMARGEVEGLEVAPVRLGLGPLGDGRTPMPTNTSSSSAWVWVTRWRCPGPGRGSTSVRSRRSDSRRARRSASSSSARRRSSAPCRRARASLS